MAHGATKNTGNTCVGLPRIGVGGLWSRLQNLVFGVSVFAFDLWVEMVGSGYCPGLGLGVWGLRCRDQGLGFRFSVSVFGLRGLG